MRGIRRIAFCLPLVWPLLTGPGEAQLLSIPARSPAKADQWPTERVELTDGQELHGLIESEDETLVGQPLAAFEKAWREYVLALR